MPTPLNWPLIPDAQVPAGTAPLPGASDADRLLGLDVSTFPDLDATFALISGAKVVAEAVARRITTPRGSLRGQPDYGIDVRDYLNEGLTPARVFALKAAIQAEAEADPRVASVDVDVTHDPKAGSLRVSVAGVSSLGPFELVLAITAVSVEVLSR